VIFTSPAACLSDILTELSELPVLLRDPVTSCQAQGSVDLGFYRDDDQGSAFERQRGRVLFNMDKHNTVFCLCLLHILF